VTRHRGAHAHAGGHIAAGQIGRAQVVVQHHMLHAGQCVLEFLHHRHAVKVAATVAHPIDSDQHLGLDLFEAIEHGVGAHVGGADAPDTPHAHRGQEGNHGLGNVGQVRRHAVTGLHALRLQMQGHRGHLATQLGPADFAVFPLLVSADDGRKAGRMCGLYMAQHLVGVVGLGSRKPDRPGHDVFGQHRGVRRGRLHLEIIPDALPESIEIGDGPAPELVVGRETQASLIAQPVLVQADLGDIRWTCVHGVTHGAQGSGALERRAALW